MIRVRKEIDLLVLDLDNTLYDWFAFFVPSFYSMIEVAAEYLGCSQEDLIAQARAVHQRHHDVEHPFALLETEAARELMRVSSRSHVARQLDPAFHAFNRQRVKTLKLYPGVPETLGIFRHSGTRIVAYSEGKKHSVMDRLRRLGVEHYFDRVFCRKSGRSLHPDPARAREISASYPQAKIVELPTESRKPSPEILLNICQREGFLTDRAAYVGDSRARDVLMAKDAGLMAVWARYGDLAKRHNYRKLVAISHWTEEDVLRARELVRLAENLEPDATIDSFPELLSVLTPSRSVKEVALG